MSDTDATQARQDVVADVEEILEHVINGNMLSMPYDVYVELFDAVDGLGVEIENLQAENAKLREELADVSKCETCEAMLDCDECLRADDSQKERKRIAFENAKLRELVRDMHRAFFTLDIDHCQACPRDTINGPCTKLLICGSDECSFEEDMRELGVDVDDEE